MAFLAALSIGLLTLCPQGENGDEDPRLQRALSRSEINALKRKTADWIEARIAFQQDDSQRQARKLRKAREANMRVWDAKSRSAKADLLKFMGDMVAVFDGVFSYSRKSTSGQFKIYTEKPRGLSDELDYALVAPRRYRPGKHTYRTVVLLPGEASGKWEDRKVYFENTWSKASIADETFFFIPKLLDGDDYDKRPDLTKQLEARAERKRIESVLLPLGEVNRRYNLDRSRMILDCGKGTCGWGMRLATYFPMRFAGLVLRHPVDVGNLQIDSLANRPILLISSEETETACKALKERLDKFQSGACEILEGKGEYPFLESKPDIDKWVAKVRRPLFPPKVILAPNHDRFGKAFWINILQMEPLDTVSDDERPRLVATADREKNTVTVKTRSVTSFLLFLNDALVDLDKEVTLVVNGHKTRHKFQRNLHTMVDELITAYDPTHLYTVRHQVIVPKPKEPKEASADKGPGDKGPDKKPEKKPDQEEPGEDAGKDAGKGGDKRGAKGGAR